MKPAEQQWLALAMKKWTQTELAERHTAAIQRRTEDAKFIRIQSADQFDFKYNESTKTIEKDYLKLHCRTIEGIIPRAVFVGNTGLGKTHLSRSLGYTACQAGRAFSALHSCLPDRKRSGYSKGNSQSGAGTPEISQTSTSDCGRVRIRDDGY
jgi:DNA replication protein DnaC